MADTREKLMLLISEAVELYQSEYEELADHLIANGVTVQQWIPVTERLPERTDGHVLVTDGDVAKISCRNAMYQTRGGEIWCAQNYGAGMCVTHWMPLPQSPKGE